MSYLNEIMLNNEKLLGFNGVVIHNDAGSMTPRQYQEWLRNRNKELGIAHWYINREDSLQVVENDTIAWHCGDGQHGAGNGYHIGYEVCESMSASDEDFLKNEEAVFKQAAKDLKAGGLKPTRDTVRLHKEFVSTSCPHRSWDLHGQNVDSVKDYFIERIKFYMDNPDSDGEGTSSGTTTKPDKPKNSDKPSTTKEKASETVGVGHIWRYNDWGFTLSETKRKQGQTNTNVNSQINNSNGTPNPTGGNITTGQLGGKAQSAVEAGLNSANWNSVTDGGLPGIDVDGAYGAQCFDLANFYLMSMDIGWDRTNVNHWGYGDFVGQYENQFRALGFTIIEMPTFEQLSIGAITFETDHGTTGDYGGVHTEIISAIEGNNVSYFTQNLGSPGIITIDTGGRPVGTGYTIVKVAIPPAEWVK